jgi:sugar lactone lactonase YvrE
MKALVLFLCASVTMACAQEPLTLEKSIALPGVKGRFDHFSVDVAGKRLALAALGNDTVEIFDLSTGARLATVPNQKKPCGVLFVPGTSRLLVANGGDGTLRAYDADRFKEMAKLGDLDDADNVRWDMTGRQVLVGIAEGALAIVNETGDKLVARIPLAAHPESFQVDSKERRAFVNVPGAKHVAVVDLEMGGVIATWSLEKWRANFPMSLDEAHRRVFVGCRSPARLLELDAHSGRVLSDCEIGGDTDDLFFDAKRDRVYVSCGDGFLDTIQVEANGKLTRVAHQPTRDGARTCFFSPALDRLYVALPERGVHGAELRVYQAR